MDWLALKLKIAVFKQSISLKCSPSKGLYKKQPISISKLIENVCPLKAQLCTRCPEIERVSKVKRYQKRSNRIWPIYYNFYVLSLSRVCNFAFKLQGFDEKIRSDFYSPEQRFVHKKKIGILSVNNKKSYIKHYSLVLIDFMFLMCISVRKIMPFLHPVFAYLSIFDSKWFIPFPTDNSHPLSLRPYYTCFQTLWKLAQWFISERCLFSRPWLVLFAQLSFWKSSY